MLPLTFYNVIPILIAHFSCFWRLNPVVRLSAVISCVGIYCNQMILSITASQMKWWWISMCLDFASLTGFFVRSIAPWLSVQRTVASSPGPWPSSVRNCHIHLSSFVASARAIYSASIVDKATVTWSLLLYAIASLFNITTYPVVDRLVLMSAAQSVSMRPVSLTGGFR